MDRRKEIGRRIAVVRAKLDINQTQLGDLLGVSNSTVSNYEKGDVWISIEGLIKLSEEGRVSLEWLIMGTDENTPLDKMLTRDELELLYTYRATDAATRRVITRIVTIIAEEGRENEKREY